jgi:hypothetical protein
MRSVPRKGLTLETSSGDAPFTSSNLFVRSVPRKGLTLETSWVQPRPDPAVWGESITGRYQGTKDLGGISAPFVVISLAVHVKVNDNVNDHGPCLVDVIVVVNVVDDGDALDDASSARPLQGTLLSPLHEERPLNRAHARNLFRGRSFHLFMRSVP